MQTSGTGIPRPLAYSSRRCRCRRRGCSVF